MTINASQPILIVEDSPEDFETAVRAFEKLKLANPILRCETGDDALDYLFNRGTYQNKHDYKRPGIILLDLNMPGTDGRDVLKIIKTTTETKSIPVVILTTSQDKNDINQCYENGANSYLHKPVNLKDFIDAIATLKQYWFDVINVPEA